MLPSQGRGRRFESGWGYGRGNREEDSMSTFEVIVSIGVTVIAICNLVTTLRR